MNAKQSQDYLQIAASFISILFSIKSDVRITNSGCCKQQGIQKNFGQQQKYFLGEIEH